MLSWTLNKSVFVSFSRFLFSSNFCLKVKSAIRLHGNTKLNKQKPTRHLEFDYVSMMSICMSSMNKTTFVWIFFLLFFYFHFRWYINPTIIHLALGKIEHKFFDSCIRGMNLMELNSKFSIHSTQCKKNSTFRCYVSVLSVGFFCNKSIRCTHQKSVHVESWCWRCRRCCVYRRSESFPATVIY